MMTIGGENLNGIRVILIIWFCFQSAFELTKVVVNILTIGHACNIELDYFELIVVFWPDGDMVAMIYEAEVFKHLYLCFFIFLFWKRVAVLVQ